MKRARVKKIQSENLGGISFNIAAAVVFLLCGIAAGCIFSCYSDVSENSFILSNASLSEIIANGAGDYSFRQAYFNLIKYPAIIFLLGFTALGFFAVPAAVFIKGFFMSFSISSVMRLLGSKGFFLSVAMFGLQTFISIPCILLAAALALEMSKLFSGVLRSSKGSFPTKNTRVIPYISTFAILAVLLLLFAVLDIALTPVFISLAAKGII